MWGVFLVDSRFLLRIEEATKKGIQVEGSLYSIVVGGGESLSRHLGEEMKLLVRGCERGEGLPIRKNGGGGAIQGEDSFAVGVFIEN